MLEVQKLLLTNILGAACEPLRARPEYLIIMNKLRTLVNYAGTQKCGTKDTVAASRHTSEEVL
jgi:hypothetical protein